jgi:small subunit ribosomal protein S8
MTMQDPISDMLVRIRNAAMRKKKKVTLPHSKIKEAILNVMLAEGYITGLIALEPSIDANFKQIEVELKYYKGTTHVIQTMKRVSKPSLRVYQEKTNLPKVNQGLGIAIVTTSKGIMTAQKAKQEGVGGEVLVEIF